jgi:Pyruvate/2-oxoacid:ferredoxin oxidoreductase gamma subunit
MGVPVSPRNIFPSNIQGLPTWYEVRVSEAGYLGRRGGVDMIVAMNPRPGKQDVAEIAPGGYLFYDSHPAAARPRLSRRPHRDRRAADRDLQRHLFRSAPAPAVQEHHLCRRALGAARTSSPR